MSTVCGIHGQLLEVTVVGCSKLKDTEWISRQDPYVCFDYATTKFRTRTCTDGGKNPVFQEKTIIPLIEGLREISVTVWNSNTITFNNFIGSGRVQLHKVLSEGYDDSSWPLQTKTGKHAGEVKLIMHYARAQKPISSYAPIMPTGHMPPPCGPPTTASYPPVEAYPSPYPGAYPTVPYSAAMYPPPMQQAYPPQPYPPSAYPPQQYPPAQGQPYYPQGPYPGTYPPAY